MTLARTLELARRFREGDDSTPIVLMGYYNPIYSMGVDAFLAAAKEAGIDGLIIVDLPPEEDSELCIPAQAAGLNFIRLATPTTDDNRLPRVVQNTSGFVYYVSITGITGAAEAEATDVAPSVARIPRDCAGGGWGRGGIGHRVTHRERGQRGRYAGLCEITGRRGAFVLKPALHVI